MDSNHQLPFKAGQQAESKCFRVGFRGAWFRCKIKNMGVRKGKKGCYMDFFDYPDEKETWTKLYEPTQQNTVSHDGSQMELMVRPSFPPFYHESHLPDSYPESDVIAIINDTWKVGDLVDWWFDSCYWSGKVIQLLGNDKVEIQLPAPPIGEGNSYEAFCKDLRPSLEWSPENGWIVPLSRENGNCWYCARLIQPHSQDKESEDTHTLMEGTAERDIKSGSPREAMPNCLNEVSDLDEVKDETGVHAKIPSQRYRYSLNCFEEKQLQRYSETIESSVIELEELANKIRWVKGFLQFGFQWSNTMKPTWRFLENCGTTSKIT